VKLVELILKCSWKLCRKIGDPNNEVGSLDHFELHHFDLMKDFPLLLQSEVALILLEAHEFLREARYSMIKIHPNPD